MSAPVAHLVEASHGGRAARRFPCPLADFQALWRRARARERRFPLRARSDPCGSGRKRRRQVDLDQDRRRRGPAGRGLDRARWPAAAVRQSLRGDGRGRGVHLSGTLVDAGPLGRGQHFDRRAAETFRSDRRARSASPGRSAARGSRLRRRQSASPRARSAAVAPPDGRDRQGARSEAEAAHPRRGDLGADQRRRREGLFAARAAEDRERRHPLHHPSHA